MKFIKKHPVIIIFILLIVLAFIFRFNKDKLLQFGKNNPDQVQTTVVLNLPVGWIKSDDTLVALKIEKQVESGYKPIITLIKSTSRITAPKLYIDNFIAGAKSAIPSLRLTSDQRDDSDDYYLATIESFYYNNGLKINSLQKVFIKDNQVFTLTASYTDDITGEINQIFDTITDNQLTL